MRYLVIFISMVKSNKNCKKINVNKAPGPNDSILKILKNFAKYFAVPEIFNDLFSRKFFLSLGKNIRYWVFQNQYHVRLLRT